MVNDPLYNHEVFGPEKGKYGNIGKTDEQLIQDLIAIHNAENWLGMDIESEGGNVSCGGLQERHNSFSTEYSSLHNDKAQRVEASSTTKNTQGIMHFNLDRKDDSPRPVENIQSLNPTKTTSTYTISTSLQSENNSNTTKLNRSETPDSAVDVNSLPASADSPSSSSSTTSSFSLNIHFPNSQTSTKTSTSTSTSGALQTSSTNTLESTSNNELVGDSFTSTTTCGVSSNFISCINSTSAPNSTLISTSPSSQRTDAENNSKSCVTTIATQTGIDEADERFDVTKLSFDPHCYECKVKYRDPSPKDLVMFLHAYTYTVRTYKNVQLLPYNNKYN